MSTPEDVKYSKADLSRLKVAFYALKAIEKINKPADVESAINPLYNWLESLFETDVET